MMQALKMLRTVQKNPASIMEEVYERMMLDEQSQRGFAQFFDDVLAAEDGSVLWHCTIGKDRAGLAAALLLHALGVKREAVEQDYLPRTSTSNPKRRTSWTRFPRSVWATSWIRAFT